MALDSITTKPVMTEGLATAALSAARAKAAEAGTAMVIAVVDAAGALEAFVRMDGTPGGAIEWTLDKAMTSASFAAPTHAIAELAQTSTTLLASMIKLQNVTLTPGGYPLILDGALVGAIAAGGGTPDEDQAVAQAGAAALQAAQA